MADFTAVRLGPGPLTVKRLPLQRTWSDIAYKVGRPIGKVRMLRPTTKLMNLFFMTWFLINALAMLCILMQVSTVDGLFG